MKCREELWDLLVCASRADRPCVPVTGGSQGHPGLGTHSRHSYRILLSLSTARVYFSWLHVNKKISQTDSKKKAPLLYKM